MDVLGLDGGLSALMTESTGEKHEAPRHLRKAGRRLKRLQRRWSCAEHARKKENRETSRRHARRLQRLARQHRQVRDRRADHHHHLSSALTAKAAVIGVEDLSMKGMARNPHLAKSVADAGLVELYWQVGYKAEWRGRRLHKVGRFERSTGCCPDCDVVGPRLGLKVRV
ncbi:RNA-guided endonuclease InsQ/TnpB family protein [Roseomonas sp. GCM10028921]